MQGSTISPALFNIFIESLIITLRDIIPESCIFGYADDIALIIDSYHRMNLCCKAITLWAEQNKTPINFKKSGILNIIARKSARKMINKTTHMQFPVVTKYKYLGIWLDETLNPEITLVRIREK